MPVAIYDTNYNGRVDTCDFIDGGKFVGDINTNPDNSILERLGSSQNGIIIPETIMNTNKYDKNNNGIVDEAENIDAGEF